MRKTQKECKEKLAVALEQAGKVDAHKTDQFTVGQWAEMRFENYAKPSIRETTAAYYKNYIDKHIIPNIGKIRLNKLTTRDTKNTTYQMKVDKYRVLLHTYYGPRIQDQACPA